MNPTILQGARPETPLDDPNPYRRVDAQQGLDDAEERRDSEGLTGEVLDQLLRNRHVEGQRLGRRQALEQARDTFPRVWDEGFEEGRRMGVQAANEAHRQIVATPVSHALASILAARGKTGSAAVKLELEAAAAQLAALYQQVTGEMPEGYLPPVPEAFQVVVDDAG